VWQNHAAFHSHDLLEPIQCNFTAVLRGEVCQQWREHLIQYAGTLGREREKESMTTQICMAATILYSVVNKH